MKIRQKLFFLLSFSLVTCNPLWSGETDNFLAINQEIADSSAQLNEFYNRLLKNEIKKINSRGVLKSCTVVTARVGAQMNGFIQSNTDWMIKKSTKIDRFPRSSAVDYWKDSMYNTFTRLEKHLCPNLNVDGVVVGSDKIAHFFGMGITYYMKYVSDMRKSPFRDLPAAERHQVLMKRAVELGLLSEKTVVGQSKIASGVLSYADLEANFQGFQFFYDLCTNPENPILAKEGRNWKIVRPFDIREYINPYMSEVVSENVYTDELYALISKEGYKRHCDKVEAAANLYKGDPRLGHKSFSVLHIEKLIREGKAPDPRPQGLKAFCESR